MLVLALSGKVFVLHNVWYYFVMPLLVAANKSTTRA